VEKRHRLIASRKLPRLERLAVDGGVIPVAAQASSFVRFASRFKAAAIHGFLRGHQPRRPVTEPPSANPSLANIKN
jgi:hypothetical protein